jgi:electron-transferring-flavoprotein dehydrogenase
MIPGLVGMAMTGLSGGRFNVPATPKPPWQRIPTLNQYFAGRLDPGEVDSIVSQCRQQGKSPVDPLMDRLGWPPIPYDGRLLFSHQDALLLGGKVQAAPGFADHVRFVDPALCQRCDRQVCVAMCSGQAISAAEGGGRPEFDREKCIHCGVCLWNCCEARAHEQQLTNIDFDAGSGGLHSAEN